MTLRKVRNGVVAAALSAGALATAVPAQAGSLERGLLAGLIGGVALGAFAAAARAQPPAGPAIAPVPVAPGVPMYMGEPHREPRAARRLQERVRQKRQVSARQRPQPRANASIDVERCGDVLEARARELGAVDVRVTSAGPAVRSDGGGILLPLTARVEYARKGERQVRQARVACRLNTDRQVVGLQ